MRLVDDTNLLLSGVLWSGAPRNLLREVRQGKHLLYAGPGIVAELEEVLARRKLRDALERAGTRLPRSER